MLWLLLGASIMPSPPMTFAQSSPQEAALTLEQLQLLNALGIKPVAPRYLPSGFVLRQLEVTLSRNSRIGGKSFAMIYEKLLSDGSKPVCFAIEATNGGIGGLPLGQQSYSVKNAVLGEGTIEYGQFGRASQPTYLGNWLGTGPFYRFAGANFARMSECEDVSAQDAVRISESLDYVDP
ncbi:MAG: hypothetical protein HC934_05880 [Acaryochloridaceae cyanobacterium SU_2_1]|nr:hypothetical protein [Acaryochloridaceae cyanobacterium SU_2_1]NJM95694.1 hypothetical protein [Acaryochloridaceae cyanobacterium CSU_5_19]